MEMLGDIARKRGDPSLLTLEAAKTSQAAEIARETGLFHVPGVVAFDPVLGILDTSRIHGLETLSDLAGIGEPRLGELCFRAGAALAAVHARLVLPAHATHRWSIPEVPCAVEAGVFLHGDFNGSNVCYDRAGDRLVILDWSMAPALGGLGTFGPRYLDIVWFVSFFFLQPRPGSGWRPADWLRNTIEGYRSVSGSRFDVAEFESFRREFDPLLRAAYDLIEAPYGMMLRRVPRWVRRKVGWHLWRRARPVAA